MTKTQVILLIALVVGFIGLGLLLARDSGQAGSTFTTDAPFLARKGTARQDARAFLSDKAIPPTPSAAPEASQLHTRSGAADPHFSPTLTSPPTADLRLPMIDALLVGSSPERALAVAHEHLAQARGAEASEWRRVVGILHTRTDPPDLYAAIEAFDAAKAEAVTDEQRLQADLEAVRALHAHGQAEEALQRAAAALEEDVPATQAALHIALTLADVLAQSEGHAEAEEAYREAMRRALDALDELGPGAVEAYRLAGLRLAQLYRAQQRHEDAAAVGQEVRRRLEYQ